MVYVDPKDIGWKPFLWRWLHSRENEVEREVLQGLCDVYLDKCIDYVCEGILDRATMEMVEPLRQVAHPRQHWVSAHTPRPHPAPAARAPPLTHLHPCLTPHPPLPVPPHPLPLRPR